MGPYQLDTEKVRLWCDTQPVRLTPKAFQVLCYVVERSGQLVTKEELFRVVWADTVVGDAALTMYIQEIRKALQDNAKSPQYLETVHRQLPRSNTHRVHLRVLGAGLIAADYHIQRR